MLVFLLTLLLLYLPSENLPQYHKHASKTPPITSEIPLKAYQQQTKHIKSSF